MNISIMNKEKQVIMSYEEHSKWLEERDKRHGEVLEWDKKFHELEATV